MSDSKPCECGYDPFNPNDQCYCAYVPTERIRKVYPIVDLKEEKEEILMEDNESLGAFLARYDLLTPG